MFECRVRRIESLSCSHASLRRTYLPLVRRCCRKSEGRVRRLQVACKELDLVADQCLEGIADVEIEVARGVHLDLPSRRGLRVAEGLGGRCDRVEPADAEE